jgi:hypothetical protein
LIDDARTESTGESRIFITPPLSKDRQYTYTLKVAHQGKTVVRKIDLAHGADNTFDLRAEFRPGMAQAERPGQPLAEQPELQGGQPPPGVKQSVPVLDEQVAYQRAFEAVLWAMPASAIYRMRVGLLEQPGMAENVVIAWPQPMKTSDELITANQVTPYIAAVSDLRKGPVVLEVPAKTAKAVLYGQVVDAWQIPITDVGPTGEDKGKGGKYLFLPPGYKEQVPDGYFTIRSSSYRILLAFRSIQLEGATEADAYAYSKTLKMYPLSEAKNPKAPALSKAAPAPYTRCRSTTCGR